MKQNLITKILLLLIISIYCILFINNVTNATEYSEENGQNNQEETQNGEDTIQDNQEDTSNDEVIPEYNEEEKKQVEGIIGKLDIPKNDEGEYIITEYVELGSIGDSRGYTEGILGEKINDSSITLVYASDMGESMTFSKQSKVKFFVYKNDIYYTDLNVLYKSITQITIPDDIENTSEAYINYAMPKVQAAADSQRDFNNVEDSESSESSESFQYCEYSLKKIGKNDYEVTRSGDENYKETIVLKKAGEKNEKNGENSQSSSNKMIWILAVVIVIGVLIIFNVLKKKNKKSKKK